MIGGISINPSTPVEEIQELLQSNLFSVVDILAVEPGFGGQKFQHSAVNKLVALKTFITEKNLEVELMVDGGMRGTYVVSLTKQFPCKI